MRLFTVWLLIGGAAFTFSGAALAETAYLEGHVFDKQSGIPIEGAVVVIHENVTLGPVPILLAEDVTDANGFYQVEVTTTFPTGVIEVFCRTRNGAVARGSSAAPLLDDALRRRDVYLRGRRLRSCLAPEPGDIPPFR